MFDVATRLVTVRIKDGKELDRKEVILLETHPTEIARSLAELGTRLLICGAISERLEAALLRAGIQVIPQICGEIELVLRAFEAGQLAEPAFQMPGCNGKRSGIRSPATGKGHRRSEKSFNRI